MAAILNWYTDYLGNQINHLKHGNLLAMPGEAVKSFKALPGAVNEFQSPTLRRNYDDYNGDWLRYLKDMAADGDEASLDRLMNYYMTEQSNINARNWTANREDTAIQRFARDARAAGFNPQALLMQGGNPIASSSSGSSYSGNSYLSSDRYSKQNSVQWASLITSFTASVFKSVISGVSSVASSLAAVVGAGIKASAM